MTFTLNADWGIPTLQGRVIFKPKPSGTFIEAAILNGQLAQLNGTVGVPLPDIGTHTGYTTIFRSVVVGPLAATIKPVGFAAFAASATVNLLAMAPDLLPVILDPQEAAPAPGETLEVNATNVNAAGAVMNADSSTAAMGFVVDQDDMVSNSNTKVPTQQSVKAYVDAQVGTGITVKQVTGTAYTLIPTDATKLLETTNASTVTITVPLNSAQAIPFPCVIPIDPVGAGQIVFAPTAGVTLNSENNHRKSLIQYGPTCLRKRGTDLWILTGSLTA